MKRGMTMIELLVAVILTSIMAIIIFQFVQEQNTNYQVTRQKIKLQSDAREGVRILEQEIRNAGFRTGFSVDAKGALEFAEVTQIGGANVAYASGAWVDPTPQKTAADAYAKCDEKIEFKTFTPKSSEFSLDENKFWRIGYCWNKTTEILSRQAVNGAAALAVFKKNGTWVPMLENVKSLSFEYGQKQEADNVVVSADLLNETAKWDVTRASVVSNGTSFTMRDDGSSGSHTVVYNGEKLLEKIDENEAGNTYRVSFKVASTEPLLDAIAGLGLSGTAKIGFFTKSGIASGLSFTFRPALSGSRTISYDLALPVGATEISEALYLGVTYTTLGATTENRSVSISNLVVKKVSTGTFEWKNATDGTLQMSTVGGIRLKASVQGKKNGLMAFERIIPVVNNETL